jgi:GPH family glycoside/pentoside/hexuronide:cation symporter
MHDAPELSRGQQLGWAAGSLGTAVMLGALTSFGLYFFTTYLGIGALVAGQLLGLSKLYGLLADPAAGVASDRTVSRLGRRRPWLLAGALACPLGLLLLFRDPQQLALGPGAAVPYAAAAVLLFATAFSVFNVPYLSMAAEMTTSPRERTLLMSQRVFFSTLGSLAITVLGPWLVARLGGGTAAYAGMGAAMAAIVLAAMLTTFFATRATRCVPPSPAGSYGLRRQLAAILGYSPFRAYMLAKVALFLAQSFVQGTLLLYARYVMGRDEQLLAIFGVGYTAGSLLALPLWNAALRWRLAKRDGFRLAALGLALGFLSWLLAGPGEPLAALYARFAWLGVCSAGSIVAGAAMLPDLMEDDRRRTGIHQEGLYAAAFSMVEKAANTLGPVLTGLLLGAAGFVATRGGELAAQPEAALAAIRLGVSVVPCALALLAAWIIGGYRLDTESPPPRHP